MKKTKGMSESGRIDGKTFTGFAAAVDFCAFASNLMMDSHDK
jgi:hypothetical protein